MREEVIEWDDGFVPGGGSAPTTLVRFPEKKSKFLWVVDELVVDEDWEEPWGLYVPLTSLDEVHTGKERLARECIKRMFTMDLTGAHGVAVWGLTSYPGARVDYHIDYCELHRYETHEIVPPLYAGVLHASEGVKGGAFVVNTRGLDHYKERGYKAKIQPDEGWVKIPYKRGRAVVFDGEYPHYAEEVLEGRRQILGFNVFGDRVKDVNRRAPEHSAQFNSLVKFYQSLTVDKVKQDKKLSRVLVALARKRHRPCEDHFDEGARVLALWKEGARLWKATVLSKTDTVHLLYDDGARWDAPHTAVIQVQS